MTEAGFLALPVEEQNAAVAMELHTLGWTRGELHRPPKSVLLRPGLRSYGHEQQAWPGRWVDGDGNAFFVMWNALPYDDTTDWILTTGGDSTGHEKHRVNRKGVGPADLTSGWYDSPNVAAAVALLRSKGVIDNEEET